VKLEPVRRQMLLCQFDFLESEIARLLKLETSREDVQKRDELGRVHESISNMAAVIKTDFGNLLSAMDGLDLGDERVQLVLGILKSNRLRPTSLERRPQTGTKSQASQWETQRISAIPMKTI
jgi:hypothetical protein